MILNYKQGGIIQYFLWLITNQGFAYVHLQRYHSRSQGMVRESVADVKQLNWETQHKSFIINSFL